MPFPHNLETFLRHFDLFHEKYGCKSNKDFFRIGQNRLRNKPAVGGALTTSEVIVPLRLKTTDSTAASAGSFLRLHTGNFSTLNSLNGKLPLKTPQSILHTYVKGSLRVN